MPADLAIRCSCGAVRGVARAISSSVGNRVICYCDDCQAFAHHLGHPERILDPHGGTDVFQISPARMEISAGTDRIACIRLRPNGLLRWYAACCCTPIGNTLATRQVPFVGWVQSRAESESDRCARDEALGPIRARIHARFALGDRSQVAGSDGVPAPQLAKLLWMIAAARLRGDHARSPFFTAAGDPIAAPRVLTDEELRAAAGRG
jgi:hypothetical protein